MDTSAWDLQKDTVRSVLWGLLGDLPPMLKPDGKTLSRTRKCGCEVLKIAFKNGAGAQVYGYLLLPDGLTEPAPAVLYHHFHGGRYALGKDEIFLPRPDGQSPADALTAAGMVVLTVDAYGFGEREHQGPAGEAEAGWAGELSLFKKFLWEGKTLWGMMLRDDLLALEYLLSRPEVDPARIAVTGMSLGGSRSTWVGALDERVKLVMPVGQMTRYVDFAAAGNYALHSVYYYVPGALSSGIDMEHIVSLVAPRPQVILIGDQDPLSPITGVQKIADSARRVYRQYGAEEKFQVVTYTGQGHAYTATMLDDMLRWLAHYL